VSKTYGAAVLAAIGLFCLSTQFVQAQQTSQSLSVSPTLFEMSANPGQTWSSSLRIINPNPYELTVYGEVVNFAPQGESGRARFMPLLEGERDNATIAEWIALGESEITIPAEQTVEVPFTIAVPEAVTPGGHFGAVLIGTRPPESEVDTPRVETSQIVTALMFLRVEGEIVESGSIRSFRTTSALLDRPEATFALRFENTGNVHLQPQGQIEIFNMWGEVRGEVPINRNTMFGNVLPDSVRKYEFTWTGDWSLSDIGRYRAVATLAYGTEARQFTTSETAFWVIPWKPMLLVFGTLAAFLFFLVWAVKFYIRRALGAAVQSAGLSAETQPGGYHVPRSHQKASMTRPLERGILDLRERFAETETIGDRIRESIRFVGSYKLFFITVVIVVAFIWLVVWFVQDANTESRPYEVEIGGVSGTVNLDAEDVEYQKRSAAATSSSPVTSDDTLPPIRIINRSGLVGLAAEARLLLEAEGVRVVEVDNEIGASDWNTVIVYHPDFSEAALELSEMVDGALLSSFPEADLSTPITLYVGRDFQNALE
jgi:hypothetical protein